MASVRSIGGLATVRAACAAAWVLAGFLAAPAGAEAGSSYLAVWSSDKEKQDSRPNTDFLAILDADPRSPSYGKVVNTASLQRVPGRNLLNELGLTNVLGLVADPLDIRDCPLVTSASDVENFSGIDDFASLPNGNLLVTYMGAKDLTTPGGLVELRLDGSMVGEYHAAAGAGRTATCRASPACAIPACSPIRTASPSSRT